MQELVAEKKKKNESNMMKVNFECLNNLIILLSPKTLYGCLILRFNGRRLSKNL